MTRSVSSTSSLAGQHTFLLSSTPLADEPKHERRTSDASDGLEIISREELLDAVRDVPGSDWEDLEDEDEDEEGSDV